MVMEAADVAMDLLPARMPEETCISLSVNGNGADTDHFSTPVPRAAAAASRAMPGSG